MAKRFNLSRINLFRRKNGEKNNVSESASHSSVLDVGAEQLGKTYARALLGATGNEGSTQQVLSNLGELCDQGLAQSSGLRAAFESPQISASEKHRVLEGLLGKSSHPTLLKFLKVMASRGRLGYVSAVRDAAVKLDDELSGRLLAEVKTAVPMTDGLRGEITQKLTQRFGKEVRLKEVVDESLIGGMVVRVGDTVFDSSVASQLNKAQKAAATGFARKLLDQADRFGGS